LKESHERAGFVQGQSLKCRMRHFRQNAEARKMPNRNLKTYRKILEDRRLAMSSGSCDSALFFDVRQLPL